MRVLWVFCPDNSFYCPFFLSTTVIYGQPFICLIVLCMLCFNCGPSLCIMYFHVFMDQIKLLLLLLLLLLLNTRTGIMELRNTLEPTQQYSYVGILD